MSRRLLLALPFLALGAVPAADKGAPLSAKDIYQRTVKSTVWIARVVEVSDGKAQLSTGSGSLIDVPQRLILTNYHVVGTAKDVRVFFPQYEQNKLIQLTKHYFDQLRSGGGLVGTVLYRDQKRDLALIQVSKLPTGTTAIPLAREGVGPGEVVHSIGHPGASDALWEYTNGSVKAGAHQKSWTVKDKGETHNFEAQVVETTSPVNPGDSGGPLLNGQGELVAVTQGGVISAQGTISFFIDVSEVRTVLAAKKITIASAPQAMISNAVQSKPEASKPEAPPPPTAAELAEKDEKTARAKLDLAQGLIKDRPARAKERLEEIIKLYPNTKAAQAAKDLLAKLKDG